MRFLICRRCGNMVETIQDSGKPMMCCGSKMEELIPNTSEGDGEKHLPVVTMEGNIMRVNVGAIDHPMIPEHYIQWICLETNQGCRMVMLKPGDKPRATFRVRGEKPLAVYAYCNIHGLWKTKI